jgi:hypothetical protein
MTRAHPISQQTVTGHLNDMEIAHRDIHLNLPILRKPTMPPLRCYAYYVTDDLVIQLEKQDIVTVIGPRSRSRTRTHTPLYEQDTQ